MKEALEPAFRLLPFVQHPPSFTALFNPLVHTKHQNKLQLFPIRNQEAFQLQQPFTQ